MLGLKVGDWSTGEDERLRVAVVELGTSSWQAITRDKTGVNNHYYHLLRRLDMKAKKAAAGDARTVPDAPSRAVWSLAPQQERDRRSAPPRTSLSPRTGLGISEAARAAALFGPAPLTVRGFNKQL